MDNLILQALLDASEKPPVIDEPRRGPVELENGDNIARIVFKDEGRDDEGRSIGKAHAENAQGGLAINYGWITWKDAERLATALGVDFEEV